MAKYDIEQLDSLEFETSVIDHVSVCRIDSTHYMVAYEVSNTSAWVSTFSVDSDGTITELDSLQYVASGGEYASIAQIDSTHYAVAHQEGGGNGWITTFSIDGSYSITELNHLQFTTSTSGFFSLVAIDSTHLILASDQVVAQQGEMRTFSLDGSYNITQEDLLVFTSVDDVLYNSLVKIDSTHFALAYYIAGATEQSYIETFEIDGSYNITSVDVLNFTTRADDCSLVLLDSTHLALAFNNQTSSGTIKTFELDGSYNVTEVDSLTHITSSIRTESLVFVAPNILALAYTSNSSDNGWIKTFTFDGSYEIKERESLEYDTAYSYSNALLALNDNILSLAYSGGSGHTGFTKTFEITISGFNATKLLTLN